MRDRIIMEIVRMEPEATFTRNPDSSIAPREGAWNHGHDQKVPQPTTNHNEIFL